MDDDIAVLPDGIAIKLTELLELSALCRLLLRQHARSPLFNRQYRALKRRCSRSETRKLE